MAPHVSKQGNPSNLRHRRVFEGELDQMSMEFPYYLYHRNPTGWEFFVPAMTLLAVKLLTTNEAVSEVLHTELILQNTLYDLLRSSGIIMRWTSKPLMPTLCYSKVHEENNFETKLFH